eukprot:1157274-Pelagomonas_calceolata.AAC.2
MEGPWLLCSINVLSCSSWVHARIQHQKAAMWARQFCVFVKAHAHIQHQKAAMWARQFHGFAWAHACMKTSMHVQVGSALSPLLMKRYKVEAYMKYVFAISACSLGVPFLYHLHRQQDKNGECGFLGVHKWVDCVGCGGGGGGGGGGGDDGGSLREDILE